MTSILKLTTGEDCLVDDDVFVDVSPYRWGRMNKETHKYVRRTTRRCGMVVHISLHRWIMKAPKGVSIDHKNGNLLDNRRANLRLGTTAQNQQNRRIIKNKHGFKGVSYKERNGSKPWYAQIKIDKKDKHLGSFATKEEAANAYDIAAIRNFGEFAATNASIRAAALAVIGG